MNVLFVYSTLDANTVTRPLDSFANIHFGISYISSALEINSCKTQLLVLCSKEKGNSRNMVAKVMEEFDPSVIAFTSVSTQIPFINHIAQYIKNEWSDKFLIIGGVFSSLNPSQVNFEIYDALCIGEGELPMVELVKQIRGKKEPHGIQNLWIKQKNGLIEKNMTRAFVQDLDTLPFPSRTTWEPWVNSKSKHAILVARGCPHNCTYCSNHAIKKLSSGKYVRFRSPDSIIKEISTIKERYPDTNEIYLQAETMSINKKWIHELCHLLEKYNNTLKRPISYTCNYSVSKHYLSNEYFSSLKRAGINTIEIGLESGSERIRSEVLKRYYTNDDFLKAVSLARQNNMKVNVYNIIGIPGESSHDYWQTIEVNQLARPDQSNTSIFFPYPGTDLYNLCDSSGLIEKGVDTEKERRLAVLDLPTFSKKEIQRAYDWFEYRIFRGNKPFHYRIRKVIRNKIEKYHFLSAVFYKLLPFWHKFRHRVR